VSWNLITVNIAAVMVGVFLSLAGTGGLVLPIAIIFFLISYIFGDEEG